MSGGGGLKADDCELFVAVAVKGIIGDKLGGAGSRRAVRMVVVAVGERLLVEEVEERLVEMYVRDVKQEFETVFVPFLKMCKTSSSSKRDQVDSTAIAAGSNQHKRSNMEVELESLRNSLISMPSVVKPSFSHSNGLKNF
ncbi:unnamed protein product [Thlaspi arvense]|uniref:Uncharacterized protein n=1 Tax=Thlaspi arvense TaxID=13288 RepID=A0AAU9RXN5_THLAR|nr:unnamed protein product [Thlaspi arvense]